MFTVLIIAALALSLCIGRRLRRHLWPPQPRAARHRASACPGHDRRTRCPRFSPSLSLERETTPCPRRPHSRRARHAPAVPVRQRFRPGPARRGQTAPPHTAHPDQRHPHCPDRRGARPDRAGDLHRAERAGREAQLPGRL